MTWWRRDSTISPVKRYAQRLLGSHEAALRTRGFSRTPPQNAKHGDDKGSDRPAGMSHLEWMQLQHYQRWRKKLMEDPYQTLFGASNDMLSGKGLKDWEWISNSFPKWMLREMGGHEDASQSSNGNKDTTPSKRYSKKIEIDNDMSSAPMERESYFPQPTPRATRISGDYTRGITSPSDMRRPREHPKVTIIGESPEASIKSSSETYSSTFSATGPQTSQDSPIPPKSTQSFSDYIAKTKSDAASKFEHLDKTENVKEASFIDEFLSENPQQEKPKIRGSSSVSTWKETTLQRRLSQSDAKKYEASNQTSGSAPVVIESERTSSTSVTSEYPSMPPVAEIIPTTATHQKEKLSRMENSNTPEGRAPPARSTSETLSQLPEDDIDFLSAADIRASMGMKKSRILSDEQKKTERETLEKSFKDVHAKSEGVDPMIESKVINDQLVRRIERRMQMPDEPKDFDETQPTTKSDQTSELASETQVESSIERMKSWLEQGGAIFSNYFWQDPTEEADAKKTRLFFDKVLARIRKGRSTMKQVIEDLETDIPSSKPLLKRMKADEDLLDSAIHALRHRSGSGKMQPLTPKKVRAIQSLRLKYQDTDSDLNKAYAALQEIDKSDSAKNMPLAFKQRLGLAAKIIQKNAHLTRYLIWSLQARLEDPNINQAMLANYKAVANSLLTLRDTQMALSRLVDRAMLVYGVLPQTVENLEMMGQTSVNASTDYGQSPPSGTSASMTKVDKAQLRAKIAAEERLANEVDAQKSAMRGLSDDGYVRELNNMGKKPFEERNSLDHSLYRPFGQALQSLGSELPLGMEETKPQEKVKHKYNDAELVVELQKAYEDTYGPITAGHMPLTDTSEGMKQEQEDDVKKFDMLKDDSTVCDAASEEASVTQMSGTQVAKETAEAVATSQAVQDDAITTQAESSAQGPSQTPQVTQESAIDTPSTTTSSPVSTAHFSTHYTILIHDAETNTLSLTTSTSPPPRDTTPPIPLHTALSTLSSPSKFIPHITPNLEIVTAKPDMLILRDMLDPTSPPSPSSSSPTVIAKPLQPMESSDTTETPATNDLDAQRIGTVNPIDGTTRLSPTGYVGPAENREQLEKEFEERRRAAEHIAVLGSAGESGNTGQAEFAGEKKGRGQGRGAGVVKTAIWAAATCYVVGVLGELAG